MAIIDGPGKQALIEYLRGQLIPEDQIAQAETEGRLQELALVCAFVGRGPRYTQEELADRLGVSVEFARKFWRAMGFPAIEPEARVLTDDDAEALSIVMRRISEGIDEDVALQLTRVIGSSIARIAEAEVGAIQSTFSDLPLLQDQPVDITPEVVQVITELATARVDEQSKLIDYGHRRHLAQAARRQVLWQEGTRAGLQDLAVGFADLVGFTALSQQLTAHELAGTVEHFETLAYETIDALGGRIVKMIGDEVMFIDEDIADAVEIGLQLSERYESDEALSGVRVGIARGEVIGKDGDYYGPVVNLASRIVGIAFPGTVVVADEVHEALESSEAFEWRALRPRRLKGIGRADLWTVRRPGTAERRPAGADWLQARRQQMAEIIADGI
ncbi:MAG: hypothetical protein DCC49_08490 [Acidobacteria bacterium]|nr:MAG: hypothetical protein DCC49_08490 [Acidobacteriota bacterium]